MRMKTGFRYCGLLLEETPLEHWSKQKLVELIIRLVLHPNVSHVGKTPEFIEYYEK